MFSERVSKGVRTKVLIQIDNSSFRRRAKFTLSAIENKYPKKKNHERAFLNQYPRRDHKRKSQGFYNFVLLSFFKNK